MGYNQAIKQNMFSYPCSRTGSPAWGAGTGLEKGSTRKKEETPMHEQKEMWNRAAAHFQAIVREYDDGYPDKLMAFLREQNVARPGWRVADIGCGTGKYALRLAELGCSLLLVDIADHMMDYAKQNLAEADVPVETAICDWSRTPLADFGWERSVDLAFASMTPAVRTKADLRKLSAMSRRYCFLSRFADRTDLLPVQAAETLGLKLPKRDHRKESRELIGWLLEDGYLPEVRLVPYGWENLRTIDEAVEVVLNSDLGEAVRESGKQEELKQYVRTLADENGMVHEVVKTTALWVLWEVE